MMFENELPMAGPSSVRMVITPTATQTSRQGTAMTAITTMAQGGIPSLAGVCGSPGAMGGFSAIESITREVRYWRRIDTIMRRLLRGKSSR
jgi:hypothetical protein